MTNVPVFTEFIKLDSFLKFAGACDTGGEAKLLVQSGDISVNGMPCTQRGKKLVAGDIVTAKGKAYRVVGREEKPT